MKLNFLNKIKTSSLFPVLTIFASSLVIYYLFFKITNSVIFFQNDEWIYYKTIENFLKGSFIIDSYIQATFLVQAYLGYYFAQIFGTQKLPNLTLAVSVFTYFVFTYTVYKFYLKNIKDSIILGLLMFLGPLYLHLSIGFMSDIYFLVFAVLMFYFIENFIRTEKWVDLVFINTFFYIGFFSKQLIAVVAVAFIIYLLFLRKYKWAIIQSFLTSLILGYYFFFFPKTRTQLENQEFVLTNLIDFTKVYPITFAGLFYSLVFISPILLLLVNHYLRKVDFKLTNLLKVIILTILLFFVTNYLFENYNSTDYTKDPYYFSNGLDRNGFFYGGSLGEKYGLIYGDQINLIIEYIGKISIALLIASIILIKKDLINFYTVLAFLYLGLMSIMIDLYDRYYLIMIPVMILGVLGISNQISKLSRFFIVLFLIIMSFYSYNFTMDYVIVNNKMWSRAIELSEGEFSKKVGISPGFGWRRYYYNQQHRYKYMFYFKTREHNKDINCCFKLFEKEEVYFPLSIFDKPIYYLYKREF